MKGRVALVTGAGRGIGLSVAVLLAERGARVMAVSRSAAELESLTEETGIDHLVESVATPEGCARIVRETTARLGAVEILVNNAGIGSMEEREIWRQEPRIWHETLATNLNGPFELTRLASARMVDQGYGRIVMVSSTAGQVGGPSMTAYCASKHGVIGLTRAAAQDLGPYGITCNAVLPGWVDTKLTRDAIDAYAGRRDATREEVAASLVEHYPAKRMVTVDEVAETIAFLCSDGASGINGETITVSLGSVW
jgi:NAD(P)-dependent dehydrogenase (short-subunit alcohol dehydrogenase family)